MVKYLLIALLLVGCNDVTNTTERDAYDNGYESGKDKADEAGQILVDEHSITGKYLSKR